EHGFDVGKGLRRKGLAGDGLRAGSGREVELGAVARPGRVREVDVEAVREAVAHAELGIALELQVDAADVLLEFRIRYPQPPRAGGQTLLIGVLVALDLLVGKLPGHAVDESHRRVMPVIEADPAPARDVVTLRVGYGRGELAAKVRLDVALE